MDLNQTSALVEDSIRGLKVDPALCRGQKPGQWSIIYKGATVWIDVFSFQDNPARWYFQVMSPLLAVPDKNLESFYQNLLEINHSLYGSWICKKNDWTYVMFLREADGLDINEVNATLDRVAFYSSDWLGKLKFKFEGSWLPKPTTTGTDSSDGPPKQ
ncbi:MAG: YbjN domain-containing protein [Bacteroidetes bacterium]|nr:YbjN domain-containing protein [Bacteroidota bacterium]